jgi:hypothetical protein
MSIGREVYDAKEAFLSKFFGSGIMLERKLDIKECCVEHPQTKCQARIKTDGSISLLETNHGHNVVILLPTWSLNYIDNSWHNSPAISIEVPNYDNVLHMNIKSNRSIRNINAFVNLTFLKLMRSDRSSYKQKIYLEDLPLNLETFISTNNRTKGQFNAKIKIKHLILTHDPLRAYADVIYLPATTETVVIDKSIQIICNSDLRCFGRILFGDHDKVDKNFAEITLPNGLEIYAQYWRATLISDSVFSKVDGVYLLKNFRYEFWSPYHSTVDLILPQNLRILATVFSFSKKCYLPNLETVYTFVSKNVKGSHFNNFIEMVDTPNLKTMVLYLQNIISSTDPIFKRFDKRFKTPICHLILEEEIKRTFFPKVNAKNITSIMSDSTKTTFASK